MPRLRLLAAAVPALLAAAPNAIARPEATARAKAQAQVQVQPGVRHVRFLGTGPVGFTAAANRLSWETPANLAPGTYACFCRIHPFMRGAFRVASS